MTLTYANILSCLAELEESNKQINKPIIDWIAEQGYPEFNPKTQRIILPKHTQEMFKNINEAVVDYYISFSEHVEADKMYIIDRYIGWEDKL